MSYRKYLMSTISKQKTCTRGTMGIKIMKVVEANIDGLVGPTHNYAGLSFGNVASEKHAFSASNPKQAALQGLRKMKYMHDLGIPQLVMPPHPRPNLRILHNLGFKNVETAPEELLAQLYSASSMWVANAATLSPSTDTADGKLHITPANLLNKFHRCIEPETTAYTLKQIFPAEHFVHHDPLPFHASFSDEGAANHMRICKSHNNKGVNIFVYGDKTSKYPARQSLFASQAVARLHTLSPDKTIFLRQNPLAIDEGVFHNDVIAMSNENLLIYHEKAFEGPPMSTNEFTLVQIKEKELSLNNAVTSYFFNSQLITLPSGKMMVIAPKECEENPQAKRCFEQLIADGHIESVNYMNLRESMKNGGGPACLRLRVTLNENELTKINTNFILNDQLYNLLCQWIQTHYRDTIKLSDLRDPLFAKESLSAISELYKILGLDPVKMETV